MRFVRLLFFHLINSAKRLTSAEPPLTPAEREIVKSYGGWTQFMICFGLKPWDLDDTDQGKRILESFVQDDSE